MANLDRIRVAWSGFNGGPGVSTFYASAGGTLIPLLHTYFAALVAILPNMVRINADTVGDSIESTTGELTGSWTGGSFAQVSGTNATAYAAPVGALQKWDTQTVLGGRRLRGHTFLVPLGGNQYDTSGQVIAAAVTAIEAAATTLVTAAAGNMVIYQRPRDAKPADGSRKAITQRDGGFGPVTASRVSAVTCVLTSRRD